MKNVGWAALIGAGVALVAFLIDWLLDHLDTPEEPEPLWPASKPYSRTTTYYGTDDRQEVAPGWPAKIVTDPRLQQNEVWLLDRNFLNPTPETWKLP